MIQLPKVSEKQENKYLANVKDGYKKALENLKDHKVEVKKKKEESEDDYQKRRDKFLREVKSISAFLSVNGILDDNKIKNILVGKVSDLEKAMVVIGPIESKEIQEEFERVYTNFTNRKFGYQWAEKLGVTVCPYCNRSYIFTVKKLREMKKHVRSMTISFRSQFILIWLFRCIT